MANDPRSPGSASRGELPSLGPDCAVLTSIGTVYLYRLGHADMRAFRELPGTRLSSDKFRTLLARVGSTSISDRGVVDAGSLSTEQIDSLSDDEIERLAEAYLDSPNVRWYRQEGASATLAVVRGAGEPATKFLDRLINWYVAFRASKQPEAPERLAPAAARPIARTPSRNDVRLSKRELWIALGSLLVVTLLAIGAFLQHYFLVSAVRRSQDALIAQVRETNALLEAHVARASQENAELRRRIEGLEAALLAKAQSAPKAAPVKSPAQKAPSPGSSRGRGATRLQR